MFTIHKGDKIRQSVLLTVLASILVTWYSCNPTPANPSDACAFGEPRPIFSDSMGPVVEHEFQATGLEATEKVLFSNGQKVQVFQSGCDTLLQEFRFPVPAEGNQVPFKDRAVQAMEQFAYLAGVDSKLEPLSLWTVQLTARRDTPVYGQMLELGPGYSIALDVVPGDAEDILIVKLEGRK